MPQFMFFSSLPLPSGSKSRGNTLSTCGSNIVSRVLVFLLLLNLSMSVLEEWWVGGRDGKEKFLIRVGSSAGALHFVTRQLINGRRWRKVQWVGRRRKRHGYSATALLVCKRVASRWRWREKVKIVQKYYKTAILDPLLLVLLSSFLYSFLKRIIGSPQST